MDPLFATMDQCSIGNNKILPSGPNAREQSSKLKHKTDQESTSPIILSPSKVVVVSPTSYDEFSLKNNRFSGQNHHRLKNHRQYDDESGAGETQNPPSSTDDYDDNKDVVVVREYKNQHGSNNHDSSIVKKMENVLIQEENIKLNNPNHCCCKGFEEGSESPSQVPFNPIVPIRTSMTTMKTTTTVSPTSSTDIISNREMIYEPCHSQPPSSLPSTMSTSSGAILPDASCNISSSNGQESGNQIVREDRTWSGQQRRQLPIIKAQSLDMTCDDDVVDQVHPHLHNSHYLFDHHRNHHHHHHHHRSHLHNQHPHHFHNFSNHPSSQSGRQQILINQGYSIDNQQRSEDDEGPRISGQIGTPTTTEDVDADVDEDDEDEVTVKRSPNMTTNLLRSHTVDGEAPSPNHHRHCPRGSLDITSSTVSELPDGTRVPSPQPRQHNIAKGIVPNVQSLESRPIYPNVPYSPYASPYGSPRSNRRKTPLRESRRISIEQSGSFLQLNQYKLMDQIGQGSYGLVKLAYSEEDSTHYAMKILSKRRLLRKAGLMSRGPKKTTTSPLDRVYREIAVLKKLDHPNVVKLVEVLDDPLEDSLYLVFELVKQGEVLEIPTEKPLTEERAWSVFRDAVQGLEYLHYQRIIHADIKPGNLLLTECGHVKIADLGVCNEFFGEDATMNNGSTAGTPAFRAPETLFPGQHLYSGKAADIWALGATLYSLVYGNVPFVASSVPFLYEKIKNEILVIPAVPVVSEELVDLVKRMLTKEPSKRITLPQIKEHPWVTANGKHILPTEDENCRLVQVSEEDINSVVKSIPKLDTLILIKTMLKNHSFLNPFNRGISGRAPQRGGSRLEKFTRAGRSNSAPGAYHIDRQLSGDSILPALSEHGVSSNCDISEDC